MPSFALTFLFSRYSCFYINDPKHRSGNMTDYYTRHLFFPYPLLSKYLAKKLNHTTWPYNVNQLHNYIYYLIITLLLFSLKLRFITALTTKWNPLLETSQEGEMKRKRQKPCSCLLDESPREMGLRGQSSCYFFHISLPEHQAPSLHQQSWVLGHSSSSSCTRTWLTHNQLQRHT